MFEGGNLHLRGIRLGSDGFVGTLLASAKGSSSCSLSRPLLLSSKKRSLARKASLARPRGAGKVTASGSDG